MRSPWIYFIKTRCSSNMTFHFELEMGAIALQICLDPEACMVGEAIEGIALLAMRQLLLLAAGLLVRLALISWGADRSLWARVEVSTPSNGLLPAKEALSLLRLGVSPYRSSACHVQPLLLGAMRLLGKQHLALQLTADLAAAWMLRDVARLASRPGLDAIQPDTVMGIYLLNPFGIASCIAGTWTPLENACVMGALLAALRGSVIGAALAVACAAYIGLHPLLLVVPLALILLDGPSGGGGVKSASRRASLAGPCLQLLLAAAWALVGLVALSDSWLAAAAALPGEQCLPLLAGRAASALGIRPAHSLEVLVTAAAAVGAPGGEVGGEAAAAGCWATHVYGLPLLFSDLTPNIGQWWYFFAQVFPGQRAFFRYVAHSLCAVFSVPLALRFPSRGLLLAVLQVGASTMLRPYPSVGDWALFLSLLPLLPRELGGITRGLFFANTFVLLVVLAPAMWTQWIDTESANSNFFYSITLLLGAWTTVLLTQLLLGAVQQEEQEEEKEKEQGAQTSAQPDLVPSLAAAGEG